MKIKNILIITYGALIAGAVIMVIAAMFVIHNEYMVIFMYIGGLIGVSGIIFSFIFLRYQSCPTCREYMMVQKHSSFKCPCCDKSLS